MPIFEFKCKDCGKKVEFLEKSTKTQSRHKCPQCGSNNLEKVISGFSVKGKSNASSDESCPTGTCPFSR